VVFVGHFLFTYYFHLKSVSESVGDPFRLSGFKNPVGMFTRRACLSLMARTTTTMTNRQARKISRQAGKEEEQQRSNGKISSVSSEGGKQSKHDKGFQSFADREIQRKEVQTRDIRNHDNNLDS
jgi:hypothetical protein